MKNIKSYWKRKYVDKSHTQRNGRDVSRTKSDCHDFMTRGGDALMNAKNSEHAVWLSAE